MLLLVVLTARIGHAQTADLSILTDTTNVVYLNSGPLAGWYGVSRAFVIDYVLLDAESYAGRAAVDTLVTVNAAMRLSLDAAQSILADYKALEIQWADRRILDQARIDSADDRADHERRRRIQTQLLAGGTIVAILSGSAYLLLKP